MAAVKGCLLLLAAAGLGCGKPVGLGGPVTPLVEVHVQTSGALAEGDTADGGLSSPPLHVALVWGMQWLPEPFCVLPPESPAVAAVLAAGCRDSFGFVPDRVGAETALEPGVPATLSLISLPAADVMVGDVTARIAYASLMVYEDRNGNGTLDVRHPQRQRRGGEPISDADGPADAVHGASFVSMTQPDRRVAYREGGFDPAVAFYPRAGCPDPAPGFSILSAGGFSVAQAALSLATGQLPAESGCDSTAIDDLVVIPLQSPTTLSQLACTANDSGGVTYYRVAPASLDLGNRTWACAGFPRLGGDDAGVPSGQQLVVASTPGSPCRSTLHYTLRGCNNDPGCATPTWDLTASPPSWWPCQTTP